MWRSCSHCCYWCCEKTCLPHVGGTCPHDALGRYGSAAESTYIHGLLHCDCHAVVDSGLEHRGGPCDQANQSTGIIAIKALGRTMLQTLQILKNSSIGSCRSGLVFGMGERMAEECKRSQLSLILNNVVSCLKQGVLPGTQPARNTSNTLKHSSITGNSAP